MCSGAAGPSRRHGHRGALFQLGRDAGIARGTPSRDEPSSESILPPANPPPRRTEPGRSRGRWVSAGHRMIKLKRVYEAPAASDGLRILVDRLWPRGLAKEQARIDVWQQCLAPSEELRKWYGHDRRRFPRFRERYRLELFQYRDELATLAIEGEGKTVTLLYAAADSAYSNAAVLKELLDEVLVGRPTFAPVHPAERREPRAPRY